MTTLTLYLPGLDNGTAQARWLKRGSLQAVSMPYWDLVHTWLGVGSMPALFSAAQAAAFWENVLSPGEWLLVEPLHLTVDLAQVYHLHRGDLVLSLAERTALLATLQPFLADYQLALIQSETGRWYLQSQAPLGIQTVDPRTFLGQSIRSFFPTGSRQAFWQRVMTELQMLLAAHPVNIARRQRGEPTLDALWLWGEGAQLPPTSPIASSTVDAVFSDDPAVVGLARAFGMDAHLSEWQACVADWPQRLSTGHVLMCFTQATPNSDQVLELLHTALRQRQLDGLTLYPNFSQRFHIKPQDLARWKVWKLFSFS